MAHWESPKMNVKERAIYEQQKRRELRLRRIKRRQMIRLAGRILVLALLSSAIFGIIMTAVLVNNFSQSPEKYEYTFSVKKEDDKLQLQKNIKTKDNTCYFSLRDMAELLGYRIMGDVNVMSAVWDNGDVVSFYIDTNVYSANGTLRTMDNASFFSGMDGDVYIPVEFFAGTFKGIELTGEKKGRQIDYTLTVSDDFSLCFSDNYPINPLFISESEISLPAKSLFLSDLSEYEKYMNPENKDDFISLINNEYPLDKEYKPEDLADISFTRNDRNVVQMREYAAKSLDAMIIEMRACGYTDVSVTSAYHSYEEQQKMFDNLLSTHLEIYDDYNTAYVKTSSKIAIPGTSEHQSGLSADLHNLQTQSVEFASSVAYKWLYSNCAKFGFILRYPKGKTEITGIEFQPWHFRYVGRYHAQKIMQSGLTLEEYCLQNNIGL